MADRKIQVKLVEIVEYLLYLWARITIHVYNTDSLDGCEPILSENIFFILQNPKTEINYKIVLSQIPKLKIVITC